MTPQAFNKKMARSIGWEWALKQARLAQLHPVLVDLGDALREHGAGSQAFAKRVASAQSVLGIEPADGMLGAGTWGRIVEMAPQHSNALVIAGIRFPVQVEGVQINADRYRFTGVRRGCKARDKITVHWGGYDVESCYRALENAPDRDGDGEPDHLGTHLMLEPSLRKTGTLVGFQGCDLAWTTWHAKGVNFESIGVDICRSPLLKFADRYSDAYELENPTKRGERLVTGITPEYGAAVGRLLYWVARLFDLPFDGWPGEKVLSKTALAKHRGVLGHHNVSTAKWDVAPWMHLIPLGVTA